ncbi:MAG: hypothetical protein FWG23_06510 [Eggerthellaceae bacterium]|jgi:hypothetical protein|nr:hypothetical protein [Eggerthellaceae bacterium]
MNQSKPKLFPVLLAAALAFSLTACDAFAGLPGGPPKVEPLSELEDWGTLEYFEYRFGSFNEGQWEYRIERKEAKGEEGKGATEPTCLFTTRGYSSADMYMEEYVDASVLDDIAQIIAENGILSWDGFEKRDLDILDGFGFRLEAEFTEGALFATGYEKYPKDYSRGHQALSSYLDALAS